MEHPHGCGPRRTRAPTGPRRSYSAQLSSVALDLSHHRYPLLHAVLRSAAAVLTDYAGAALDVAVTGRPVVSFAPDLEVAAPGLALDMEHVFPGPVCRTFDELTHALDRVLDTLTPTRPRATRDAGGCWPTSRTVPVRRAWSNGSAGAAQRRWWHDHDEFQVYLRRLAVSWLALRRQDQPAADALLGRALDEGRRPSTTCSRPTGPCRGSIAGAARWR